MILLFIVIYVFFVSAAGIEPAPVTLNCSNFKLRRISLKLFIKNSLLIGLKFLQFDYR